MKLRLKRLRDQTLVITGASSGIGLVTARLAARRGARLVVAARSGNQLEQLAAEIRSRGGRAVPVVADVGNLEDVQRIADAALQHFNGFDTWVNDAGISVFGRLDEVALDDQRRLFDTNYWGMVHGSLVAARYLRKRGGAIINLGSVASDRAFPLQGAYCASKHAVKGFTDALRMELEQEGAPISITLIKPTAIATPFVRHAGNYLSDEPTLPPPVYAPELVAKAILHSAETPERDLLVGDAARVQTAMANLSPRLMDRYMEARAFDQQHTGQPKRGDRQGKLHQPSHDLTERGEYPYPVHEVSVYNTVRQHPLATGATVVGAGLALTAVWALLHEGREQTTTASR